MVKKVDSDWQTFNVHAQSSSIRKYLDACKDWLVSHEDVVDTPRIYCNMLQKFDEIAPTYIGMMETEVRNVTFFKCSICSRDTNLNSEGKTITANPFTRAQFMLVCNDCIP